jgi:transcriptional regulator with XRE-family HTH domain
MIKPGVSKKTECTISIKHLAANLLKIMVETDSTQFDFAERLGITQGFLSLILNCQKNVSIEKIDEFGEKLGIPTSKLIDKPELFDVRSLFASTYK